MRRAIDVLALLASLASLLVLVLGGGTLLVVQVSGERGAGALLALCGIVGFALTAALLFLRSERFREPTWRAGAVAAAVIAAMPVAGLAAAALRFAGLPIGSAMPAVDWPIFLIGLLLALGAAAIVAVGVRRARETAGDALVMVDEEDDDASVVHMQQIRDAQLQLRTALRSAEVEARSRREPGTASYSEDGDIRVRRV